VAGEHGWRGTFFSVRIRIIDRQGYGWQAKDAADLTELL
jgi:hypothetical protein